MHRGACIAGKPAPTWITAEPGLACDPPAQKVTHKSPFPASSPAQKNYVVRKNNHYITVDVTILTLHDSDVSRIGSVGNKRFEQARLTAELFFRMCTAHKAD
jgi:hypothetical protein